MSGWSDLEKKAYQLAKAAPSKLDRVTFNLEEILFGPQLAFVTDKSRFKTAVCSRRAGKTFGCAAELLASNLVNPQAPSLYFTQTRAQAKRNVWPALLAFNRKYKLGYEPNESELVLKKNGLARIILTGADSRGETEKWRGTAYGKIVGDEAQAFPEWLREAVEQVLMPSLMDFNGSLSLIGTPAPIPSGYFFECTTSPEWQHHTFNFFQNPHIPNKEEFLRKVLQVRGLTQYDPSIRREFFGEWTLDQESLVLKFDRTRNVFRELPIVREPWETVIGTDLGYDDADAIAVIAFSPSSPNAYLIEEWTGRKQSITELSERLQRLISRHSPRAVVVDQGGLGKKIVDEMKTRASLPLKPAEKQNKHAYYELLNDALRTGRFLAKPGSLFEHDAFLLEWDRDKSTNDRRVVSNRFHSDIIDAVLYAFRESAHWMHVPAAPARPAIGTPEYWRLEEARMFEEALQQAEERRREREGDDWSTGDVDWRLQ